MSSVSKEKLLQTVEEISSALSEEEIFWNPDGDQDPRKIAEGPGLSGGLAGLAVFHASLAKVLKREESLRVAERLIEAANLVESSSDSFRPGLAAGACGLGWARDYVSRMGGECDASHNEALDDALLEHIQQLESLQDYDLISGCVGWGIYTLERRQHPTAVACTEQIIDWLDKAAHRTESGAAWFTPPELLPDHQRKECPEGYYNLGLAHGIPGVIFFLSGACATGIAVDKAKPLLESSVRWLMSKQMKDEPRARFTYWLAAGQTNTASRTAWCYGDPGVVAALFCAAKTLNDQALKQQALEIAKLSAQRTLADSGVVDPGLCHGSSSLAQIFTRMYEHTGESRLAEAANYWLEQTFVLRRPGEGIVGFLARRVDDDGNVYWEAPKGLLEGAAGIGLAFLSALSPDDLAWDRVLGISHPR